MTRMTAKIYVVNEDGAYVWYKAIRNVRFMEVVGGQWMEICIEDDMGKKYYYPLATHKVVLDQD